MKNDTKITAARQKKQAIVNEFADKVGKSKAMIFTNYQGLTHHQIEELKRAAKKVNAEFIVTKNTLLDRALKEKGYEIENKKFQQPTATLFAYDDIVSPLKEIAKSIKNLKLPVIKFGLLSRGAGSRSAGETWDLLTEEQIVRLSTLPSRLVLLAQVVGGLKSPIFGLHRALNWNLQKLVMTLKAIESKKASSFN